MHLSYSDPLTWVISALVAIAVVWGTISLARGKDGPLKISVPANKPVSFVAETHKGNFAEVATALMLASEGWTQIASHFSGPRGLDGLFVRKVKDGAGYELLATETKANASGYGADQMSDAKVLDQLGSLFALGLLDESTTTAMVQAVKSRSQFFRKELWRHNLTNGETEVVRLNSAGEPTNERRKIANAAEVLRALDITLSQFDTQGHYIEQAVHD